jgi:hypothetical protein
MPKTVLCRLHPCATLLAIALLTAACSTTQVDATWLNDQYAGRRMSGTVLVVALTRDETLRRLYEDEMRTQLAARGVQSVRSHEAIGKPLAPGDAPALVDAARRAGATRIIASALVGVEHLRHVRVDPMPGWRWDYFGWYQYYWPYGYARADVYEFDRYRVSTTLTDAANGNIVWSASTRTDAPGTVTGEIKGFVTAVVSALDRAGLL